MASIQLGPGSPHETILPSQVRTGPDPSIVIRVLSGFSISGGTHDLLLRRLTVALAPCHGAIAYTRCGSLLLDCKHECAEIRPNAMVEIQSSPEADDRSLCKLCDYAVDVEAPEKGQVSLCPVCLGEMARHHQHPYLLSLQFTLAGLVAFGLVLFYPFLTLSAGGFRETSTVAGTAISLWNQDFPIVASLVLGMTLILPAMRMLAMVYLLLPLLWGTRSPFGWFIFRIVENLGPWSMVDVFFVGVLVAVVKLVDLASVTPGIGLFAFVALMLLGVASSVTLDREFVWQHVRRDGLA
jgi:paraquat-inducible protein A